MIKGNRIYIVGAGQLGRSIAREIEKNNFKSRVAAFLDDDREKIGSIIDGIPVLGPIDACAGILDSGDDAEALIALPSASRVRLNSVYEALRRANFSRIRILPSVSQIVSADPHIVQAREMDPQDLLGREPVLIDLKESLSYVRGKRVLVTGAGGSIGSELSRQLLYGGAERLYLLGHGENSIYSIQKEIKQLQDGGVGEKAVVVPVIGELQDRAYVNFIVSRLKADIIFHGAAHKHVPMMELNPVEAVKNNVMSTKNLVDAALKAGTERFVLISTDKAVEPLSVYGASKRFAELIVLAQQNTQSEFTVVRFGNVLGSRGSIMPLFKEQILVGGPVTVTHPDARRWFMTIPEAVSLVLKTAGLSAEGGLYLLDMGEPVRIVDFARQMIRFYGYDEESIPITFIGMRPGEKKKEQLWSGEECPQETEHPRIIRVACPADGKNRVNEMLAKLEPIVSFNKKQAALFRNRYALRQLIRNYFPTVEVPRNEPEY
ncbi:MAG: polysaccharide biosynthesis protein [Spirochaeta sp. LUC14_002_19_P3]|nr:MAG: polysaccharide biosynthesis protein [Spirochaeta sp. LUC14_002_19_P3]